MFISVILHKTNPDTYYAFIKELAAGILASSVPVMTTNVGFGYEWEVIASASPAACCFKLMRDKSDNRYYIIHVLSIIATTIQI
jgi:hypothetical protein